MARSVWKGKSVNKANSVKNNQIWDRGTRILSQGVGQVFKVYNGQKFTEVMVEDVMVGKTFGDFVVTRRMGVDIHIKKGKKKR